LWDSGLSRLAIIRQTFFLPTAIDDFLPEMVIPAILCPVKHRGRKKRKKPDSPGLAPVSSPYLGRFGAMARGWAKLAPNLIRHIG
jgi:hypothetical protein